MRKIILAVLSLMVLLLASMVLADYRTIQGSPLYSYELDDIYYYYMYLREGYLEEARQMRDEGRVDQLEGTHRCFILEKKAGFVRVEVPSYGKIWLKESVLVSSDSGGDSYEPANTNGLSCYQIGYNYAFGAMKVMAGYSLSEDEDIVVPSRCRGKSETQRGINDGTKAGGKAYNIKFKGD